jgi:NaMN:DMB phosphoribosyltransferase
MTWKNVLGGLAALLAVVAIVSAIPDMKRYIRISTM